MSVHTSGTVDKQFPSVVKFLRGRHEDSGTARRVGLRARAIEAEPTPSRGDAQVYC